MQKPSDILAYHEQKHKYSCVAWSLELVLKLHGKINIDKYPLQEGDDPCGWQWGKKSQEFLKKEYGIIIEYYEYEWEEFENTAIKESNKAHPLLFTFPVSVGFHYSPPSLDGFVNSHTCLAFVDGSELKYRTRQFQMNEPLKMPFKEFYRFLRTIEPDHKIHCLLHN